MENRIKIIENEQMEMVKLIKIAFREIKYLKNYTDKMGKLPDIPQSLSKEQKKSGVENDKEKI